MLCRCYIALFREQWQEKSLYEFSFEYFQSLDGWLYRWLNTWMQNPQMQKADVAIHVHK